MKANFKPVAVRPEIYQGEDKTLTISTNEDLSSYSNIEFVIDATSAITKTLADGKITNVTATSFDVQVDAADTASVTAGKYKYQVRATSGSDKTYHGKLTPDGIKILQSSFINPIGGSVPQSSPIGNTVSYTVTESDVTAHQAAIRITESQITDLSHFTPTSLLVDYGFTDNSANWNTAFGWGDHSTAGYVTGNSANWDTAFGWGDHSTAGYITSYTVTEGDVTAHEAALSITESQISDLGSYATDQNKNSSTINNKTASYTLALTDEGETIRFTSGTNTLTIPANASVAMPVGTFIGVVNDSGNNLSIAITTDTLEWTKDNTSGTRTLADGGGAVLQKVTSTLWKIAGSALLT